MIADLGTLATVRRERSRAINAENPTGAPGRGGMAASELGPSRKGSPCLRDIASGRTVTLADVAGPGCPEAPGRTPGSPRNILARLAFIGPYRLKARMPV